MRDEERWWIFPAVLWLIGFLFTVGVVVSQEPIPDAEPLGVLGNILVALIIAMFWPFVLGLFVPL